MTGAHTLALRRVRGLAGPLLPATERPLTVEDALDIQTGVGILLNTPVMAFKCGLPTPDGPVLAPIYADTISRASPCSAWLRQGQVRIEPELAFVLGHDLPPREAPYTPMEVNAAIASTHMALELIDSRYEPAAEPRFLDLLADGLLNQGLFLGPAIEHEAAGVSSTLEIELTSDQGDHLAFAGVHPATAPRAPLYWLAEYVRCHGQGLMAGQAIITGSYAGTIALAADRVWTVRYHTEAFDQQMHVSFVPLTPPGP